MTAGKKLRALALSVLMVFSVFAGAVAFSGTALAAGTAGNVSLSINAGNSQVTVTVDDQDLNTNSGTAETHVVNIESASETQPAKSVQTGSDTGDGSTQTVTVTPSSRVADRTGEGSITKADFSLTGASDEKIKSVSGPSGGKYTVTVEDTGSSTKDGNPETVTYTTLEMKSSGTDTSTSQQITTSKPVADRTGDGSITKADFKQPVAASSESITNVQVNNDRTVTLTISDSSDSDSNAETYAYLAGEWVQLTETGQDTGTFAGSISTTTSSDRKGVLKVSDGDTITATYWEDGTTKKTAQGTYSTTTLSASASASPTSAATGESISLDGTSSTGSGLTYQWDTDGDPSTIEKTGSTASVSYASSGVKQITLIVNDGSSTETDTVNVAVGDSGPPTAKLEVFPRFVTKNKPAYLVAQESTDDLKGGIKKYEWDVGADGSYDYSSTKSPVKQHTFTSSGDKKVKLRVTDYAGHTDTLTKTVTVQGKASVSSTSVKHTGNGTAPTGTINVKTRNEGGMLKLHLYRGASSSNRDLSKAGVDESTELWVNVTISNYEPNAMMASAKVDEWLTVSKGSSKTKVAIKMHPINMQRLNNPGSTSPGRWPSKNKQADKAITPGAHLATFDMPDGTEFEKDFDGATLTSDAQQFSPPRYNSQTNQLTYTVAAPHWKASGNKVSSNTNSGFYEAWIPKGLVSSMGIKNPDELAGTYKSGGTSSSLTNMDVSQTASGGLHINVTGIHYSSGTVQLSPDSTAPTADAGSDQTVTAGNSVSFDGSASSDNRKISKYEWDVDGDNTYDLTGEKPSHTYSSTGSKTVTLRVTDGNGNTATDKMTVTVNSDGTAPTASTATSSKTVNEDTSVSFDAAGSSDNVGVSTYKWDFDGDNTIDKQGSGLTNPSHTYSAPGTYTAEVTVEDSAGNTDTAQVSVTANDVTSSGGGSSGGSGGSSGGGGAATSQQDGGTDPVEVTSQGDRTDVSVDPGAAAGDAVDVDVSQSSSDRAVTVDSMTVETSTSESFTMNVSASSTAPEGTPEPEQSDVGGEPAGYIQVDHSVSDEEIDSVTVEFTVDRSRLDERDIDPDEMVLYRYHDGEWQSFGTTATSVGNDTVTASATVAGLSTFAIGTDRGPAISVASAGLESSSATAGEAVTVSATVENVGKAAGSATVALAVDGTTMTTRTVDLAAGESTTLSIDATFETTGEFDVTVGDVTAGTVSVADAATPTDAATPSPEPEPTPASTAGGTATSAPAPTPTPSESPTDAPETTTSTGVFGPGFGPVVALLALVVAGLLVRRRRK